MSTPNHAKAASAPMAYWPHELVRRWRTYIDPCRKTRLILTDYARDLHLSFDVRIFIAS